MVIANKQSFASMVVYLRNKNNRALCHSFTCPLIANTADFLLRGIVMAPITAPVARPSSAPAAAPSPAV
jgi:hypothetical protein